MSRLLRSQEPYWKVASIGVLAIVASALWISWPDAWAVRAQGACGYNGHDEVTGDPVPASRVYPCSICGGILCQPDTGGPQFSPFIVDINTAAPQHSAVCTTTPGSAPVCHTPTCQNGDNDTCYTLAASVSGPKCSNQDMTYTRSWNLCCDIT